ncbi:winged helix DNA-binding domain-containing protein [Nocardiopsis valliformis]|uniref:winged helix DNA-binding domain-containing protein n=1 Tax=Nocardiopsis valliformis TaxID=239974 RepID=UPI00034CAE30|nr:winged helix DNA-binding domain-containing protein [Nocardiopsis valliformis]
MEITWEQVLAWRLQRQFVVPRGDATASEIIGRLCGVQAQVASSAESAVGNRQNNPLPGQIDSALNDRSIVKTWSMRGTLHLVRSEEAASYLSLLASGRTWEKPSWQREFGATPQQIEDLADAVSDILYERVLTRAQMVAHLVGDARFAGMEQQLKSGWGTLLKPLAWKGVLCHGPKQGGSTTFTSPASLLPDWKGVPEADDAAPNAISAYLGAHGPATPEAFDAWLSRNSLRKTVVRRWFKEMGDALREVEVEGQTAYVLAEHADELADTEPDASVRLLGGFDQYILGPGTKDQRILPAEHRAKVSRTAGWISPIVLVGGRVVGVWDSADGVLTVKLFEGATEPDTDALETEADRVARLGSEGDLALRVER